MNKRPQDTTTKRLLGIEDICREYSIGRGTVYMLADLLPHVRVGKRLLFRREDLEALLERAAAEGADIRALALAAQKGRNPAGDGGEL